ncbi:hypothetical protein DACRYDRAFT_13377 [Dacryopinax primogenitus]|uniref:Uncharacterized protein n=1 Tax=Dacryopinax primogenitus (strain DJM 731) TaxID=1858805 RepID=M5G4W9_DACPD|nr:uncharacterized protein DACRYDRAFT_13377 [Dacryopinax primogenitus]EJU05311.1 hypothetical protein DACRYDRAFT_13377 [Dacryopinax primogenitus]
MYSFPTFLLLLALSVLASPLQPTTQLDGTSVLASLPGVESSVDGERTAVAYSSEAFQADDVPVFESVPLIPPTDVIASASHPALVPDPEDPQEQPQETNERKRSAKFWSRGAEAGGVMIGWKIPFTRSNRARKGTLSALSSLISTASGSTTSNDRRSSTRTHSRTEQSSRRHTGSHTHSTEHRHTKDARTVEAVLSTTTGTTIITTTTTTSPTHTPTSRTHRTDPSTTHTTATGSHTSHHPGSRSTSSFVPTVSSTDPARSTASPTATHSHSSGSVTPTGRSMHAHGQGTSSAPPPAFSAEYDE